MSSSLDPQRQRHGVTKNLVEGLGGVLVGAAAVLLLRSLFRDRSSMSAPAAALPGPSATAEPATPRGKAARASKSAAQEQENNP